MLMERAAIRAGGKTFIVAMSLVVLLSSAVRAAEQKRLTPAEEFLRQAPTRIENRAFGRKDREACEQFLRGVKQEERLPFLLVLARYYRVMEKHPVEALMILGPEVVDAEKFAAWAKANAEAEKEALAKWREEERQARWEKWDRLPEKPSGIFAPFPPFAEWKVDYRNAECAVEIAYCLVDLSRHQEALAVVNALGEKFEETPRVLSAECGGDLMARLHMYQKAVDFYDFGLKVLRATVSYYGEGYTAEQKAIRTRMERKLAEARRFLEMEKYGKGWVLYRDAEQKRRIEKAYAEALLLYEDIRKEFSKTVWSEAATCYSVKCLLALSEPENARRAVEAVKWAERELDGKHKCLAESKVAGVPDVARKEIEDGIRTLEVHVARMRGILTGTEAAKAAERMARAFIKENEFGLYRGEAMADIAAYAFERELDPRKAEAQYALAWEWLGKAEAADAALASFDVPGKAREVSTPPADEEKADYFGNFKRVEPCIGAVLNRRTCSWYLDDLRERCALALGFIEFYKGEKEDALRWYKRVTALDKKTGHLEAKGEWNNYSRLKWGAEHGYLYAHPEELRFYEGRQRFVVLLADFHFVTERFGEAADLYGRLLSGEFGRLSGAQGDYPQYALAACAYWTGHREQAFGEYLKVLEKREGTFTELRAAYAAGNISSGIADEKLQAQGMELLRGLIVSGQRHDFVYQAMIVYGKRLVESGRRDEGIRVLKMVPKGAAGYHELAQLYLAEYEKADLKRAKNG